MTLRVLLLAYEFPPLTSSGVHRALAFARELPKYDIELEVVTVRVADAAAWSSAPQDAALLDRIPAQAHVHRIPSGFPDWYWSVRRHHVGRLLTHYLPLGDPVATFWRRPLQSFLDTLMPRFRPRVLLATAPPFGVAMLGESMARRYRIPWIVDMRDPWIHWGVVPFPTRLHYRYARRAEHRILSRANIAVATSPVTRDQWLKEWPTLSPERIVTIFNGYDTPADDEASCRGRGRVLAALPPDNKTISPPHEVGRGRGWGGGAPEIFRIVHTGNFYYAPNVRHRWWHYEPRRENWLYRSPYFFLRGVRALADTSPALAQRLDIVFAGQVPSWLPEMLRDTGTESLIRLTGPVSHAESLALQRSADALLITSAKVETGRDYSVAGKLFEYFAARRPIFGVLTDGAMRDLVQQSGLGVLADPDDVDAIVRGLRRLLSWDAASLTSNADEGFLRSFERRVGTRQMAECLRQVAAEGVRS